MTATGSTSILRRLRWSFIGFGLSVALIFPFYAQFFVEWKPGMLPWFVVGCVVAGASIGVFAYAIMNRILLSRLSQIARVAERVGSGDLTVPCALESADLIGNIADSFRAMSHNMAGMVAGISRLSQHVSGDAHLIDDLMAGLDRKLESHHANSRHIVDLVDNMSTAASDINGKSSAAAEHATESQRSAFAGQTAVHRAQDRIASMHEAVNGLSEDVTTLARRSEEIQNISASIREIADQTNLLALNAAIEAARAGESGRGFAVVADEVRKLAEKTTQATQEISTVLQQMHRLVETAVAKSTATAREMDETRRLSSETGAALDAIVTSVSVLTEDIRGVAHMAAEQQALSTQILVRIRENEQNTQEAANNAAECRGASGTLSGRADVLTSEVAKFRVA